MTASSGGEERGARFTVRLPLMHETSVDQEFTAPASSGSALLDGLSFLLVDDDVAAQEVLAHLLRNLGAQVHTATGAADALNCLEAGSFDILRDGFIKTDRPAEGYSSRSDSNRV
ncbi:response regulator [Burkholderia vietnamiensis]|uniref:response regulator n=1 Tax=Burkholderia vietnamiensis TaxID=60552 RepID=UPI001E4FCCC5|nr:hypothetical protein [Burkholderia vietnamiensis]